MGFKKKNEGKLVIEEPLQLNCTARQQKRQHIFKKILLKYFTEVVASFEALNCCFPISIFGIEVGILRSFDFFGTSLDYFLDLWILFKFTKGVPNVMEGTN